MATTNLKNKHHSAEEKLRILKLLTEKKQVSVICEENKISVGSFYAWKNEYETNGFDGLKRKEKSGSNHPQKTSPENVSRIIEFSIAHPELGCCSIASKFKIEGWDISSPTIQKHLLNATMGKKSKRIHELEKRHISNKLKINDEQMTLINKNNPYFEYFGQVGTYPGEVLVQDTFQIFKFLPETYIYVVIDTFSCYVFAQARQTKSPAIAVEILQSYVLNYFSDRDFRVRKIITGKDKEFTRTKMQYVKCLNFYNIKHEIFNEDNKRHHGYVKKFKKDLILQLNSIEHDEMDLRTISENVSRFINEFNDEQNLTQWFPTFGRSPASIVKEQVAQKNLLNTAQKKI